MKKVWLFVGAMAAFIVIGNLWELGKDSTSGSRDHGQERLLVGFGVVDIEPRYAAESAKTGVRQAVEYWQARGYDIQFTEGKEFNVRVDFLREYGGEHLGLTYLRYVQVSLGDSDCGGEWAKDWTPYAPASVLHIATHELGHALGLGHNVLDPSDIMFPAVKPHYGRSCGFEGEYQFEPGKPQVFDVPFAVEYSVNVDFDGDGGGNYYNICYVQYNNSSNFECSERGFDPAHLEARLRPGFYSLRLICRTASEDCLMPYSIQLRPDSADLISP